MRGERGVCVCVCPSPWVPSLVRAAVTALLHKMGYILWLDVSVWAEEAWKANVLPESQGEGFLLQLRFGLAVFLWHLYHSSGELGAVSLCMLRFLAKWKWWIWIHRMRRAQENQNQGPCSSIAGKANPSGSCSATSLLLPLGSSGYVELFLCTEPAGGCSLTFCYFSGVERLGRGSDSFWDQPWGADRLGEERRQQGLWSCSKIGMAL